MSKYLLISVFFVLNLVEVFAYIHDDLAFIDELKAKKYVITEPGIGPGNKGRKCAGKFVTIALSPIGKDQPVTNPERASDIESRMVGPYSGSYFKALGFAEGRELVIMVDGKIEKRLTLYFSGTMPFQLTIGGIEVSIKPAKVSFATSVGWLWGFYNKNVDIDMYVVLLDPFGISSCQKPEL